MTRFRALIFTASFLTFSLSLPHDARADNMRYEGNVSSYAQQGGRPAPKDWTVKLGAGALVTPEYEGADDYQFLPLPYFDINYKDRVRLNPVEGLEVAALQNETLEIGVGLSPDFGRDEDEDSRLNGLGDVDWTAEGRGYIAYTPGKARFELSVSQDLFGNGHDGMLAEAKAGYAIVMPQHGVFLRPGVSVTWAGDDYMDSYFGVNAAQAAASQFAQYDADAGIKEAGASLFASRSLTEHWSLNGLLSYSHLMGDASGSPITEKDGQMTAGVFVVYEF